MRYRIQHTNIYTPCLLGCSILIAYQSTFCHVQRNDLKKNTFLLAIALIAMCLSCWVFAHPSNTAAHYSTAQEQLPLVQMPEDFYIVLANGLYEPGILPRLFSWTVLKNLVDQDTYENRIIICNATGLFITGEQYVERIKQAVHQKIIEQDGRRSAHVLYIGISFGAPSIAQAAAQLESDGIQASAMVSVNGVISGSLANYLPGILPVIKDLRTDSPFLQHAETAFRTLSQEQVQVLHFTGRPDWLVSTKQSTAPTDALRENRQNKKIFLVTVTAPINHFFSWMAPSLHHELREMISHIKVTHSVTPVSPGPFSIIE